MQGGNSRVAHLSGGTSPSPWIACADSGPLLDWWWGLEDPLALIAAESAYRRGPGDLVWGELASLGHALRCCSQLGFTLRKSGLLEGLLGPAELAALPKPIALDAARSLTLLLEVQGGQWRWVASSLPWLSQPAWLALLQLPGLRHWWQARLRRSQWELLRRHVGAAWLMNSSPCHPAAEIAGLGHSSWREVNSQASERCLALGLGEQWGLLSERRLSDQPAGKTGLAWLVERGQGAALAHFQSDERGWMALHGLCVLEPI